MIWGRINFGYQNVLHLGNLQHMQFLSNIWHSQRSGKTLGAEQWLLYVSRFELFGSGTLAGFVWNGRTLCSMPPYWDDFPDSSRYTRNCSHCTILLSTSKSEFAARLNSISIIPKALFPWIKHLILNSSFGHSLGKGILKTLLLSSRAPHCSLVCFVSLYIDSHQLI